ncbi:MAG: IS1634 family transposase, partial [Chloroflexota bacterium]|nr:IS1634 family transposase [Chloroflexota bacterium]
MLPDLTITNEQINSLPFLLGLIESLGIRQTIDTHLQPHGHWQGISVGTAVTLWLSHLLQARDHRLVAVRDWAAQRAHTLNTLLGITLRDTDCTDDRLANILSMLGDAATQATLDAALTQSWLRVYRLRTDTVRLDSTSVSVHHDPDDPASLFQLGVSKDHRPDLNQFKVMLATLDPLGLPLVCQTVAGNASDDTLYVPAYDAAVGVLDTTAVLVVGDSKMGALGTRGHIVACGSTYLCTYRPPSATGEIARWMTTALARRDQWHQLETLDTATGELVHTHDVDHAERTQTWRDPATQQEQTWTERVLLVRSLAYAAGLRRIRERQLARLTEELLRWCTPPTRGRKKYHNRAELEALLTERIARAGLSGVVHTALSEETLPNGATRWVVERFWVDRAAWQELVDRLGWQVYVTNTLADSYDVPTIVEVYHGQAVHERGFSRLKTRNLQIRPVYLRDEQRIAGLVWLLTLALRVLTLVEYRARATLEAQQAQV